MAVPRVSVVVLNYNGWKDTRDCLESVLSVRYGNLSLIVVDNGSRGNEAEEIDRWLCGVFGVREEIPEAGAGDCRAVGYSRVRSKPSERISPGEPRAFLLASGSNCGFAGGNNLAMEFAFQRLAPDYVMLLNSDTVLEPDALSLLVGFAETERNAGSVQPRLLRKGAGGIIDSLGIAVFTNGRAKDVGQGERDRGAFGDAEIFGACAAAALYRSSALEDAGFLDERFFITLEDVDLAWRLRLCGYSSYCVSAAVVHHGRGITSPKRMWEGFDLVRSYNQNKNHLFLVLLYYPAGLVLRYLPLNLFRFFAALLSGACLGRNYPGMLRGTIRRRRDIWRKYPNIVHVQDRWLVKGRAG